MNLLTTDRFLKNLSERYPDLLGLDLSQFDYKSAQTSSIVRCLIHNIEFMAKPTVLYGGSKGCLLCKSETIRNSKLWSLDKFISKSREVHDDKFDYSSVDWKGTMIPITIICKIHGEFQQIPQSHYSGRPGCLKCSHITLRKTLNQFIKESIDIHGDRYQYDETDYMNNYTDVKITCNLHGSFMISPISHLIHQRGCPTCYPGNRSWPEIQWLNDLNIPNEFRQIRVKLNNRLFYVDAKIDNIIYEFWGDFWHGNPKKFNLIDRNTKCGKTFGELYEKTMKKRKLIIDDGYELIEIWESDYRSGLPFIQTKIEY